MLTASILIFLDDEKERKWVLISEPKADFESLRFFSPAIFPSFTTEKTLQGQNPREEADFEDDFFPELSSQGYELVGQFRPLKSELSTKSRTRQTGNDLELAQPTKNIITLFVITQITDVTFLPPKIQLWMTLLSHFLEV